MRALVLLVLCTLPVQGYPCIVSPEKVILNDPIGALARADAVFYATVRRWAKIEEWRALADIEVHEVWKGHASPMLFNYLGSTCSSYLEEGSTYLVYAKLRTDGQLEVEGNFVPASRATEAVEELRRHAQ